MATYQVVYWQEIPSLIDARDDNGAHKEQLSQQFQALIDHAAMIRKLAGTDAYLDQWSKGKVETRPGTAKDVAKQVAAEFESRYAEIKDQAIKKVK